MSVREKLEINLKRYFNEEKIKNFIQAEKSLGNLFHYPVIIRNIPNGKNPFQEVEDEFFKKPCECSRIIVNNNRILDCQSKAKTFFGDYVIGYVMASRCSNSYEATKNNLQRFAESIVMDLQNKLDTYNKIIGSIRINIEEMETAAGYRVQVVANVGVLPQFDVYDANSRMQRYEDILEEINGVLK